MENKLPKFYEALRAKARIEVVTENATASQLRVVFRVPSSSTKTWMAVVKSLLQLSKREKLSLDLSKQFFLVANNLDDMRFGYRLILQGSDYDRVDSLFSSAVDNTRVVLTQLDEVPLVGTGKYKRGKSGPLGSVPIGPLALRRN